ncbi:LacI family DNA-binding transcriptional regulator [Bifidobacterium biavatii]|uniref:LacI family transcription regulator n=1 Tax=Bifidobacterium biavatii DSM 23969 TaxID=1437608 RepID=A0A087A1M6_9BIFI|nr:LacI family DNA-binding transcriptional regulator [Bifidobacterium biavatii]KFI52676.1 LacI family transcription regulator [Bifidobacterium biavatii DSM 23969]
MKSVPSSQQSKPTLKDVAEAAGVSIMTVSNALHNKPGVKAETRKKVLAVARRMNYSSNPSAKMLRSGRSDIIEVIVGSFDNPFYSRLASALSDEIERNGREALLRETHYDRRGEENALSEPFSLFCDGVIIVTPLLSSDKIKQIALHKPVVLHEMPSDDNVFDTVNLANEDGAADAIRHLYAKGCRNIAVIGSSHLGPEDMLLNLNNPGTLRYRGCFRAFNELGLTMSQDTAFDCGWDAHSGREAAERMLTSGIAFDGAFCLTDSVALGVLQTLRRHGIRVPDDFKVIGFDGISMGADVSPTLTTIEPDYREAARALVADLLARIDGSTAAPRKTIVGYTVTERESA